VAVSLAVGQHAVVVLSGSMEPALAPGDVLIEEQITPANARIGDIVTYREPGSDRYITHRVRSVQTNGDKVVVVTKGDANNATERWQIPADGKVGVPMRRIPLLGYLITYSRTPAGIVALLLVPLFTLAALELLEIWWPLERKPNGLHA
jgi:signal peptidase